MSGTSGGVNLQPVPHHLHLGVLMAKRVYSRRPLPERFWSKVDRSGGPDACWPWIGYRNAAGYGVIMGEARRNRRAHCIAYELQTGEKIPPGSFACHSCDSPCCCNAAHLWLGTHNDNMADMAAKGRAGPPRGERNGCAKLTAAQVVEIRALHVLGTGYRKLARRFGINQDTAREIVKRHMWKHV